MRQRTGHPAEEASGTRQPEVQTHLLTSIMRMMLGAALKMSRRSILVMRLGGSAVLEMRSIDARIASLCFSLTKLTICFSVIHLAFTPLH